MCWVDMRQRFFWARFFYSFTTRSNSKDSYAEPFYESPQLKPRKEIKVLNKLLTPEAFNHNYYNYYYNQNFCKIYTDSCREYKRLRFIYYLKIVRNFLTLDIYGCWFFRIFTDLGYNTINFKGLISLLIMVKWTHQFYPMSIKFLSASFLRHSVLVSQNR